MSTLLSPLMFAVQHPIVVIVCIVVQMIIGMIWYEPLFGASWAKLHGIVRDPSKSGMRHMMPALVVNILSNAVQAVILGRILTLTRFSGILTPMIVVLLLWLAFQFSVIATGYAYMKKPIKILWIDSLYPLVSWEIMTLIIVFSF